MLKSLRSRGVSDDLGVQLDVFEEQRESDEAHIEGRGCWLDNPRPQPFLVKVASILKKKWFANW